MWILKFILYSLLLILGLIILKELIPYLRYKLRYAKQGIPYNYFPILGVNAILFDLESKDIYGKLKKFLAGKYKNKKVVAFHSFQRTGVSLWINDLEILKEFFIKENDVTRRLNFTRMPFSLGFFVENGHKGLKQRTIFNKFFMPNNLKNLTPQINKIIKKTFLRIKEELYGDQKSNFEFKEYDFKKITGELFNDIVNEILFGSENFPLINGKKLPQTTDEFMGEISTLTLSPVNLLSFGLLHEYNLLPESRRLEAKAKNIMKVISKILKERKKKKSEDLGVNLMDLMIKHNRTCSEDEKLDEQHMITNVFIFEVAGFDTTKSTAESFVKIIAEQHPKISKKISDQEIPKIIKTEEDWNAYENYDKSDYLNEIITEFMRMYPPAGVTFDKLIVKDFKAGGHKFYKGDTIGVPLIPIQFNENNFKNPNVFDEKRFSGERKKEVKRGSYLPFYEGKRMCIGKNIALLELKMILSRFYEMFEVKGVGEEIEMGMTFSQAVKSGKIMLRWKGQ